MPHVDVDLTIHATFDEVWTAILDIDSYPNYMANVREAEVLDDQGATRTSRMSVLLKGSVLEWTEVETIDREHGDITFHQLDGDLDLFAGFWKVVEDEAAGTVSVTMAVDFEIGIPLLADMLNPVAARALRDNSEQMLREIESRVRR